MSSTSVSNFTLNTISFKLSVESVGTGSNKLTSNSWFISFIAVHN